MLNLLEKVQSGDPLKLFDPYHLFKEDPFLHPTKRKRSLQEMLSLAEAATVISDLLKSRAAYERLFYGNEVRDFL